MGKSHPQISSYTVTSFKGSVTKSKSSKDLKNPGIGIAMTYNTFQAWVYQGHRGEATVLSKEGTEH